MTGDGKLLKLTSLASLFIGLASIGLGVVLAIGNLTDIDAWVTASEGLFATVYGVRTSILANVPSNTAKIRGKALILLLVSVAVVALGIYLGTDVTLAQLAIAGFICGIAIVAVLLAHRIVKEQLRK